VNLTIFRNYYFVLVKTTVESFLFVAKPWLIQKSNFWKNCVARLGLLQNCMPVSLLQNRSTHPILQT